MANKHKENSFALKNDAQEHCENRYFGNEACGKVRSNNKKSDNFFPNNENCEKNSSSNENYAKSSSNNENCEKNSSNNESCENSSSSNENRRKNSSNNESYENSSSSNENRGLLSVDTKNGTNAFLNRKNVENNSCTLNTKNGGFTFSNTKNCGSSFSSTKSDGNNASDGEKNETSPERPDGAVETKKNGFSLRTITVVGQIEGHSELPQSQKSTKYELLIPQLVEIEENDEIDALLLILNTVGGDVEAGLALSELISGMKKPTASIVLGGGHSIGVPLAVSAKRSFIVPTATMTLHPVRVTGLVLGAPQSFVQLSRMQERIISFVSGHSNISSDRLRELMLSNDEMTTDLGTILDGKAAVSEGLIDQIGSLSDATEYLKSTVKGQR